MDELKYLAGLLPINDWHMFPSERLALIGLLQTIKPKKTLEIGHFLGGCTKYLSLYSEEVFTVDINPYVIESSKRFNNVRPFNTHSLKAMENFLLQDLRFDLAIIDGDHSKDGAAADVTAAMKIADVIIMHDAANPECRRGYSKALVNSDAYYDLDFVDGKYLVNGAWGGFGLILTNCKNETYKLTETKILSSQLIAEASKNHKY